MMIIGLVEALLILPPYLFFNWIRIQIFVINILMCMSMVVFFFPIESFPNEFSTDEYSRSDWN